MAMYLEFYRLREDPFGVTPDPRFLFLSEAHRETLRILGSGIERNRGFLALVAEPGMGKTTLAYRLLHDLGDTTRSLFLFQTQCDSRELFRYLLSGLGAESRDGDIVAMHEKLNEILARESLAGRRFVLVIDEAQNLSDTVLETVRLLSDFETPSSKLIQIVLVGQPQLARKLSNPELAQLRQRLAAVAQLRPLSSSEVAQYIHHRLNVAGCDGESLFTVSALERIADLSHGIPRVINNICSNALDIGNAVGRTKIDPAIVEEAAALLDLDLSPKKRPWVIHEHLLPDTKPTGAPVPIAKTDPRLVEAPAREFVQRESVLPAPWVSRESEPLLQLQAASRDSGAPKPAEAPARELHPVVERQPVAKLIAPEAPPAVLPDVKAAAPARELHPVVEPQPVAKLIAPEAPPAVLPEVKAAAPAVPAEREPIRQVSVPRPAAVKAGPKPVVTPVPAQDPKRFTPDLVVVGTERRTIGAVAAIVLLLAALAVAGWYTFYPLDGTDSVAVSDGPSSYTPPAVVSASPPDAGAAATNAAASTSSAGTARSDSAARPSNSAPNDNRAMNAITVIVKPGQSLQQICMQYVGRYDDVLLRQIRELNPAISNFDHIEVGQEIWIPISGHAAATGARATGAQAKSATVTNP